MIQILEIFDDAYLIPVPTVFIGQLRGFTSMINLREQGDYFLVIHRPKDRLFTNLKPIEM